MLPLVQALVQAEDHAPRAAGGDDRPDLRSLSLEELSALVAELGERPFRARQLFRWLHHKGAGSLEEMTDLPRPLRARLAEVARLTTLALDAMQVSVDGTRKYRFRTWDGKLIESVYMPDEPGDQPFDPDDDEDEPAAGPAPRKRVRRTLCVSTQVGCAMGCGFCLTATMGLVRNLTPGEIADQVYRVNADLRELLAINPSLRVMIAHGYSDMVTPYSVSRYMLDHLPAMGDLARAQLKLYRGGHMFYIDADSRKAFTADAKAFYQSVQ